VTADLRESCGTYGGYQQHGLRKEPPCERCKEAARKYKQDYRNRKGPGYDRWWNKTRGRALELLAAEYPGRFRELLAEVRRETGPTPWDPGERP
jgi:hypothetical protein